MSGRWLNPGTSWTSDAVRSPTSGAEDLLRELAPQVLGALVRRFGHFDTAEDAVQEALLAAAVQWPRDGRPDNPRAWLITVASRRLTDQLRSESARRDREQAVAVLGGAALDGVVQDGASVDGVDGAVETDATLTL